MWIKHYISQCSFCVSGTSNWSADYFNSTAGVGLVIRQNHTEKDTFRRQLEAVFNRDWYSPHAKNISDFLNEQES